MQLVSGRWRRLVVAGLMTGLVVVGGMPRVDGAVLPPGVTNKTGTFDTLEFTSAALGGRSSALVWRPPGYKATGKPWPVAYFLHGELQRGESARSHVEGLDLGSLSKDTQFVVVAPDLEGVCASCVWTDGHNGLGVAAESYVQDEVIPLVQQRLNVRTDRGGRALLGTSMGGTGALVQGFRRPDRFGFIGAMSPLLDLTGQALDGGARYGAYLAGQGFAPRAGAEIDYRNISPLALAPQVVAANVDTVIAGLQEEESLNARAAALLAEMGLPHTYSVSAGPRLASDAATFRRHVLDRMARSFDAPLPPPHTFSYKTADPVFSVWDYGFAVDRPNTEFLNVLGARLDGTDFVLAGTGNVQVTTPAAFVPGSTYRVVATPDPRTDDPRDPGQKLAPLRPRELQAVAGADGRLAFPVALRPGRHTDEQEALVYAGQFELPHVRVEVTSLTEPSEAAPATDTPPWQYKSALPEPFADWNVSMTPWANNPQVFTLEFDSPVLGFRARNYVHLPNAYLNEGEPFPVLYFLHGTVDGTPTGSAKYQSWNMGFHEQAQLGRQRFVVVSLDMNEVSWCYKCWWLDALPEPLGAPWRFPRAPVMAESHLYKEVVPLIEAMFRVRNDRSGRGIIGNSMGGTGAVHQAVRHPDRFAFAGGVSGVYDSGSEYTDPGGELIYAYTYRQNYPRRVEKEVIYRNFSPLDLATQVNGTDLELMASIGDGCIDFLSSQNHCEHYADSTMYQTETIERRDNDHVVHQWTELGMPHQWASFHGTHWFPDPDVYRTYYLDRINRTFANARTDPVRFSYKTTDRSFSAWGYDFAVDRLNTEFLNVLGARLDGRSFALAGTGTTKVTTPPRFEPGTRYKLRITDQSGTVRTTTVVADAGGRLTIPVTLAPPRTTDERRDLVETGQFPFPITTVDVS